MKELREIVVRLCRKYTLTREQADHLATIKFPCC